MSLFVLLHKDSSVLTAVLDLKSSIAITVRL